METEPPVNELKPDLPDIPDTAKAETPLTLQIPVGTPLLIPYSSNLVLTQTLTKQGETTTLCITLTEP